MSRGAAGEWTWTWRQFYVSLQAISSQDRLGAELPHSTVGDSALKLLHIHEHVHLCSGVRATHGLRPWGRTTTTTVSDLFLEIAGIASLNVSRFDSIGFLEIELAKEQGRRRPLGDQSAQNIRHRTVQRSSLRGKMAPQSGDHEWLESKLA